MATHKKPTMLQGYSPKDTTRYTQTKTWYTQKATAQVNSKKTQQSAQPQTNATNGTTQHTEMSQKPLNLRKSGQFPHVGLFTFTVLYTPENGGVEHLLNLGWLFLPQANFRPKICKQYQQKDNSTKGTPAERPL